MTERDPLAKALASLTPTTSLNRDRLHYEAGRAAGSRSMLGWRLATVAGLGLAVVGLLRPANVVIDRQVEYVERPAAPAPEPTAASEELAQWLKMRNAILDTGIEHLPPARPGEGFTAATLRGRLNTD